MTKEGATRASAHSRVSTDLGPVMTKPSQDLSDGEILDLLVARWDIAHIGAAAALVAVPALLITPDHGRVASA